MILMTDAKSKAPDAGKTGKIRPFREKDMSAMGRTGLDYGIARGDRGEFRT